MASPVRHQVRNHVRPRVHSEKRPHFEDQTMRTCHRHLVRQSPWRHGTPSETVPQKDGICAFPRIPGTPLNIEQRFRISTPLRCWRFEQSPARVATLLADGRGHSLHQAKRIRTIASDYGREALNVDPLSIPEQPIEYFNEDQKAHNQLIDDRESGMKQQLNSGTDGTYGKVEIA